ncbi:hypothetical protein TNCV_2570451 [Trichonephila clavipes]|nr:hypothetical protein TNCV_2570451 [Trichonephila clavipes]
MVPNVVGYHKEVGSISPGRLSNSILFASLRNNSRISCGRGSLVVKLSDRGWLVTNSSPVSLKIHRVAERYTLNLSRAQTFSRWCEEGGASSGVVLVT